MSHPTANPKESSPAPAPGRLRVSRDLIGLMGELKTRSEGGNFTAYIYTGFLDADGDKEFVKRSTKTNVPKDALAYVNDVLIPEQQAEWDKEAPENGRRPGDAPLANSSPAQEQTAEQQLMVLEERWDNLPANRRQTHKGYVTESRAFRRIAGQLVRRGPSEFNEEECEEIVDTRLEELDPDSASPEQCMASMRVVLQSLQGFPSKFIDLFRPPKRTACRQRKDMTVGPAERTAILKAYPTASWTEKWAVLQGVFGSMHIRDAAMSKCEDFREARDATCRRERSKNGNPFRYVIPRMMSDCADERLKDPKAVYMNPQFVFTEEELANNPTINQTELTKEQEAERATNAAAKLRKCFNAFLKRLKLNRPGLSYRSFRHTNISEWEASGVPRPVGMCVTGQWKEENYIGYITATFGQLKALADLTLDFWRFPGRRVFLTITQAVIALMRLIIKSELRQRKKIGNLHEDVRAMRRELQQIHALMNGGADNASMPHAPSGDYPPRPYGAELTLSDNNRPTPSGPELQPIEIEAGWSV